MNGRSQMEPRFVVFDMYQEQIAHTTPSICCNYNLIFYSLLVSFTTQLRSQLIVPHLLLYEPPEVLVAFGHLLKTTG